MSYSLRPATLSDVPTLASFHRLMFEEMAILNGSPTNPAHMAAMEAICRDYLQRGLADGSVLAWAVVEKEEVVAAGALTLRMCAPGPTNLSTRQGHLHSIYTLPAHRRMGLARRIVLAALEWSRAADLQFVSLNASSSGRPLYDALGFRPSETAMRLDIP